MEDFTLFDAAVGGIVLISGILAYSRGVTRELMSIAGWVGAAVVAFYFAPQAEPFVREIPFLSDLVGDNCELGIFTAFAGVFVIALIIISLFTPLIAGAIQKSALSPIDAGLGFLFGIVRGIALVLVLLIVYDFFIAGGEGYEIVETSKTRVVLAEQQETVAEYIPTDIPDWLIQPYNTLTADCEGASIPLEDGTAPIDGDAAADSN